jgi:hypothetical protein
MYCVRDGCRLGTIFWFESLKGKRISEDLDVNRTIILKLILGTQHIRVYVGLM